MPNEVGRTSPRKPSAKKPIGEVASVDRKGWRNESELMLETIEETERAGDDVMPTTRKAAMGQSIINFDAEVSDRAFDLGMPKQKLSSPDISGPAIGQGGLCSPQRMSTIQPWIQTGAPDPLRDKPSILAGRHLTFGTTTACEKELARPFVSGLQVVVDGLASLFAEFKSNRPPSFSFVGRLPDRPCSRWPRHPLVASMD